jgi:hypothetical protein
MFSEYFNTGFSHNPLIILRNELTNRGIGITDLTESNPTVCGFDYSVLDTDSLFRSERNFLYHPDAKGYAQVRDNIASYYNSRYFSHSGKVNRDNIFLTSGTSESYSHLFKILCNPGDEILIPKPGYPLFELLAGINYLNTGYYRLNYVNQWNIDFNSLENSISEKTKAIIIVNPNNPTGSYLSVSGLRELSDLCSEYGIPLICDEVFYDYNLISTGGKADFVNAEFDFPLFILNGLSKISATPQFKLGWILINSPEKYLSKIINNLEIVCDTYLSVNAVIQNSFGQVFEFRSNIQEQIKQRVQNNYKYLISRFEKVYNIEGGWNAVLELPHTCNEENFAVNLLRNQNVFIHPGYFYDFDDSPKIVISLILPAGIFKEAIDKTIFEIRNIQ